MKSRRCIRCRVEFSCCPQRGLWRAGSIPEREQAVPLKPMRYHICKSVFPFVDIYLETHTSFLQIFLHIIIHLHLHVHVEGSTLNAFKLANRCRPKFKYLELLIDGDGVHELHYHSYAFNCQIHAGIHSKETVCFYVFVLLLCKQES